MKGMMMATSRCQEGAMKTAEVARLESQSVRLILCVCESEPYRA